MAGTLTRYVVFDSWDHLLRCIMQQVELAPPDTS